MNFRHNPVEVNVKKPIKQFIVLNLEKWCKSFKLPMRGCPVYKPQMIGHFSVSSECFYQANSSQLKYYVYPAASLFPLNVNTSDCAARQVNSYHDYMDHILSFIVDNRRLMMHRFPWGSYTVKADIVCHREVLETLMCTPFHPAQSWKILTTKYRNTIYMCMDKTNHDMEENSLKRRNENWEAKLCQYLYTNTPNTRPDTLKLPDVCAKFMGVYKCSIASLTVVYSAPMCGAYDPQRSHSKIFSAIDTKLGVLHTTPSGNIYNKPHEMLVWWAQCFLTGMRGINVGYASPSGCVNRLFRKPLNLIVRDNSRFWKPSRAIQFLEYMLQIINYVMKDVNNPSCIFEFEYVSITGNLMCNMYPKRTQRTFLADWYRMVLENID